VLVVTTENVPGHRVREVKGQVFGVVVRSRGLGGNIMAGCAQSSAAKLPSTHNCSRRRGVMLWTGWSATRVSCTLMRLS
jgi:uncharacterized protein YbjQ (UPF0145 family)